VNFLLAKVGFTVIMSSNSMKINEQLLRCWLLHMGNILNEKRELILRRDKENAKLI